MKNPFQKNPSSNKSEGKFRIFIWTLFDFANTSYSIVVVTFLYAVYFKQTVVGGEAIGDFYWSIGTSISMLITALISPVLGAIADYSAGKKRFLLFFTLACIISTSLLYFINKGDIFLGLTLFILANVGFEAGLVFYDSFLPEITAPKNYGRVSGYGFAMGYLGSLTTLALVYPFIEMNMIKETFPLSALVFFVFAIPLFIFIKDNRTKIAKKEPFIKIGIKRVFNTITHLKNYKNLSLFLLAFFFYIEGVNTIIFFSGNYASTTLHFTMSELIVFFLIVQTTAIIGSLVFGLLADSFGQKNSLVLSLIIWIITILFAFASSDTNSFVIQHLAKVFNTDAGQTSRMCFYIVGLFAGSVMGATQSTSRSLMSRLTPFDRKTEFFGFYSLFGKSSAILGPLVFGYVSYITGEQRFAILTICVFFVVGLGILSFVKDESAGEINPAEQK
ncbi:MAG: MFS transporter [Ignavibacteriae bacterium HGW-Ignavibacteriae-3]|nr:MAG: MFS transporter [Ignavibacteriae bacterium HGW-Ignavibacteriae-3]